MTQIISGLLAQIFGQHCYFQDIASIGKVTEL